MVAGHSDPRTAGCKDLMERAIRCDVATVTACSSHIRYLGLFNSDNNPDNQCRTIRCNIFVMG